jgi:hypothetical protein
VWNSGARNPREQGFLERGAMDCPFFLGLELQEVSGDLANSPSSWEVSRLLGSNPGTPILSPHFYPRARSPMGQRYLSCCHTS